MPADANAFQRLIDRVLFPSVEEGAEDSSKPRLLLQALLVQNSQARSYAQRLVQQRVMDRAQDLKSGPAKERLHSLLEIWPAAERAVLRDSLDRQAFHRTAVMEPAALGDVSLHYDSPSHSQGQTPGRYDGSGYATPPRRSGDTPNWGPPLSDSPPPPREQYPRPSGISGGVPIGTQPLHARPFYPQATGAAQLVDSTATTAAIHPSRESATGRIEVEESSSTVQLHNRTVASSLDSWLRSPGRAAPLQIVDKPQISRSRSMPATHEGHKQLVLDFGPSSSSGDDGKGVPRADPKRRTRSTSQGKNPSSDEVLQSRPDSRRRLISAKPDEITKAKNLQSSRSMQTVCSWWKQCSGRLCHHQTHRRKNEVIHALTQVQQAVLCLKRLPQILSRQGLRVGLQSWRHSSLNRLVLEHRMHQSVAQCSSWWRQFSARLGRSHIHQLCTSFTSAAAELARTKCTSTKWQAFALGSVRGQQREAFQVLMQVRHALVHLRRFPQVLLRHGLRLGFQEWRASNRIGIRSGVPMVPRTTHIRRFLGICEHARRLQQTSEMRSLILALHQCAWERRARRESASRRLLAWMNRCTQGQLSIGFIAIRGVLQVRSTSNCIAAQRLAACLEKVQLRRSAKAMSNLQCSSLRYEMQEAEETSRSKAMEWAARRCLSHIAQAIQRTKLWAWHQLSTHSTQRSCEERLGVILNADREMGVEAVRMEYEAKLRTIQKSEAAARQNEVVALEGEAEARRLQEMSRVQRLSFGVWSRAKAQDQAVRRLISAVRKQHFRLGFAALRASGAQNAVVYLEAQIDCFDMFVAKRNALTWRLMQKCTSEWMASSEDASLRLVVCAWQRVTNQLRRASTQQQHACHILVEVANKALRRNVWASLCSSQRKGIEARHRHEQDHMRHEHENLKTALRATQLQTEATLDSLGHQVREQEQVSWTVSMDAEAARTGHTVQMWNDFALNEQRLWLRRVASGMRQASVSATQARAAGFNWHRCAAGATSLTIRKLSSALFAAAAAHGRVCRSRLQQHGENRHSQKQLVGLIRMARVAHSRHVARSVVVGFTRLYDAQRRLRTFARILATLQFRTVMRRLHHWSRANLIRSGRQACDQSGGARMLGSLLSAVLRNRQSNAFLKWQVDTARCRRASQRCSAQRAMRPLERVLQKRVADALCRWRCKALGAAFRGLTARDETSQAQKIRGKAQRCLRRSFRAWHGVSRGQPRFCALLAGHVEGTLRWAMHHLRLYSIRQGHSKLKVLCLSSAMRRHRMGCLTSTFRAWHAQYCLVQQVRAAPSAVVYHQLGSLIQSKLRWALHRLRLSSTHTGNAKLRSLCLSTQTRCYRMTRLKAVLRVWSADCALQRVQRDRLRNLHKRMAFRMIRCVITAWIAAKAQHAQIRRLGVLLRRAHGSVGLCAWRTQAGRIRRVAQVTAVESSHQKLMKHRSDCERLMEKRSLEFAERTSSVLLHAWRCAAAAEAALNAQHLSAARVLVHVVTSLERSGKRGALERWRATAHANVAQEAADSAIDACTHNEQLERVRQGCMLLQSVVKHRGRLVLSQALHGTWHTARWHATVRALDSSAAREQRKQHADYDALQMRMKEVDEQAQHFKRLQEQEEERNSEAHDEAVSIMSAVKRERLLQEAAVETLQAQLRRSEDREAIAMERAREAEDHGLQEVFSVEEQLREARAQAASVDGERRSSVRELTAARSEIYLAGRNDSQGRHRERALEEEMKYLEKRLQKAEQDAHASVMQSESNAQEHERIVAVEMEERARHAEKEMDRIAGERDRNAEMQAAMADEQDRTIRRLEDLLREQSDQLRRERRDYTKSVDQLRSTASLSESKTNLFAEQVSTLRQQLSREQAEVRAEERAWASDRAALIAAVATTPARAGTGSKAAGGGARRRSPPQQSGAGPLRAIDTNVAGRAGGCPCNVPALANSVSLCPWHGNRPRDTHGSVLA